MVVKCPECGSKGRLSEEFAGQMVLCPQCGVKFAANKEATVESEVKWYYAKGREKLGPATQGEFERLIVDGVIAPDTLVWHKGMTGWQSLTEVRDNERTLAEPQEGIPFSRDREDNGIQPGVGRGRRRVEEVAGATGLNYAGGGKRFVAKVIDLIFMLTMASLVEGLSRKLLPEVYALVDIDYVYAAIMAIDMLLWVFYTTWFVGKFGATPGKMVFNLKIVTPTGGQVGYGQAFGRFCGEFIVIFLTLLLGYLPILFDSQRRGLHDRFCSTRVVVV